VRKKRAQTIQENYVRERDYLKADAQHMVKQKDLQRTRVVETEEGITFARSLPSDRFYVIHVPAIVKDKKVPVVMMFHGKHE
jgi:poly(3-hydroxybutyrate) depolymerase